MERHITFFGSDRILVDVWSGRLVLYVTGGKTAVLPSCCLCSVELSNGMAADWKGWSFVWRAVRSGYLPLQTADGRPTSEEYYCQDCYHRLYRNGLGRHLKFPDPDWLGQRNVSVRTKKLYPGFPYLQRFWGLQGKELDDFRKFNQALFGGFSAKESAAR